MVHDNDLGSDYTMVGKGGSDLMDGKQRSAFETLLKLPRPLAAQTPLDALWEICTVQADPTGQDRVMPQRGKVIRLGIGGISRSLEIVSGNEAEAALMLDMLKREYTVNKAVDEASAARSLTDLMDTYGLPKEAFLPAALAADEPLPMTTTLLDDFNRTDSGTLGTASGGFTWANVATNDIGIVSNAADNVVGSNSAGRAESDLSSANMTCQQTVPNGASWTSAIYGGPAVSFDSSAFTCYTILALNGTNCFIYRWNSGTPTQLASGSFTMANNDLFLLDRTSNDLTAKQNGSTIVGPYTDASPLSGFLRAGLQLTGNGSLHARADLWQATDGAASGSIVPIIMHQRRMRMN